MGCNWHCNARCLTIAWNVRETRLASVKTFGHPECASGIARSLVARPCRRGSELDDRAGDGAGDAFDLLDVAHDHAPEVVHGRRLRLDDHVVGTGHRLGRHHPVDGADLLRHVGRLADIRLDQDVCIDGHGTPYIGRVAMSARIEQFKDMARQAGSDLFDQAHPIGRLSLVQCAMLGGGTAVTISLAGSLFFSISPSAASHKVLLYLLFTIAPFAIVSPFLGPLIDKSRGARRAMVVVAAVGQAVLCPLMAM